MADFGAEVIKVETPGTGDPFREWGQARHEAGYMWWPIQSRNKKLITLDLRSPRGREICLRLIERVDVVVENFRPGTLEAWGLSPAAIASVNSRVVIARLSGYGQTGPYAHRPGFAAVGEAMSGLRALNGFPGQPPPRLGLSIGDSITSLFAVQGILMALYHRDVHGAAGQVIDASILESCFAMLESVVPEYAKLGVVREPSGTRLTHQAPSNVYQSKDGRWLVVAANSDKLWRRLCEVLGRPELAGDERYATNQARVAHADEIDQVISAWVAKRDVVIAESILVDAGIVCGAVSTIADVFNNPQIRERQMLIELEDERIGTLMHPGITPKLSATPGYIRFGGCWKLGSHNDEVYRELLGMSSLEIADLAATGVI